MDDFFDEFEAEEYGMEAEIKAFERVSATNPFLDLLSSSSVIEGEKRRGKPTAPTDKFYLNAYKAVKRLNDETDIKITPQDVVNMADKSRKIIDLQYKNPLAYILGYIVSSGGRDIDKAKLKSAVEILREDDGVEAPDIVRYARFWKNLP
jgi:hypothetical protein